MTALQEVLASFKKVPAGGTNGNGNPAPGELWRSNEARIAWQRLIDEKLIEWGRHPEQFEDEDGYKAPTSENLIRATEFIVFCRDLGVAPPVRMVPDGDGGIVFDWKPTPPQHVYLEIHADGGLELLVFDDCNLVARQTIGAGKPT